MGEKRDADDAPDDHEQANDGRERPAHRSDASRTLLRCQGQMSFRYSLNEG